jgi:mono/diheme cytochrome c family protein
MRPLFLLAAIAVAVGCERPQLPQCDEEAATELVFDRQGYPAYAGQALVQEWCTSCHAETAVGANRRGAPHHMNFDTVGMRTADPTMADEEALERLETARNRLFETRFDVVSSVERGTMPPGDVGAAAHSPQDYAYVDGTPLPSIASEAGQETLRQWLACGTPMVERTADPDDTHISGEPCPESDVGTCIVRGTGVQIDPTWSSIYTNIIEPACVICHGPTGATFVEASQLDLGTSRLAYDSLVGVAAMGMDCAGMAADRVIAGDADGSFLVHKLENETAGGGAICGGPMPVVPLPASQIAVIRQWIDDGALDN